MDDQQTAESVSLRSSIKPELIRLTLKRGGWIAAFGALIIVLGGTLLPLAYLQFWGVPLFFSGLFLIAIGWLPYRKLQRLELKPDQIHYDGTYILYVKQEKPLFKILKTSIAKLEYEEKKPLYGAAIALKKPVQEKVKVLQAGVNVQAYQFKEYDLFFPFFTQSTVLELKDLLESDRAS